MLTASKDKRELTASRNPDQTNDQKRNPKDGDEATQERR
jgi:hypothetical protein